jgi:hypothetical protein
MYTASHNTGIMFKLSCNKTNTFLYIVLSFVIELGYGQLKSGVRGCAINRKSADSIPDKVIPIFIDLILPAVPCRWGRLSV